MICGGWSDQIKVADQHVQNLVNQVKAKFSLSKI